MVGALATDPNLDQLVARRKKIKQRMRSGRGNRAKLQERLGNVKGQIQDIRGGAMSVDPVQGGFQELTDKYNQSISGIFERLGNQGSFEPGDYGELRQRGENVAMDSFNRQMNPVFEQQQGQFEQRMAERGIPVGSELYNRQMQEMQNNQNAARQNAMTSAFSQGANEANTAYNQQLTQYQMPTNQLAAMSPYYNVQGQHAMQQGQQQFLGGQAQLDRQHQMDLAKQGNRFALQQIAATPRGGGGGYNGMPLDQQMQLMDREFYNNMVLSQMNQGNQMPLPSAGSGFTQGFGAGIGMGLGSGLR